ncbi:piggyBac transposable element-derived protein 4 isoform X2 [Esox lucius]|uniref:piggyBac transposable element-derived protein 4 isoform X2 n=1 Tax=Esox lucius TaxID=8010 RepID=UPI0014768D27|nr:piggyBac transposable element-derived protein 4 isoform X2 [Esox lucius]
MADPDVITGDSNDSEQFSDDYYQEGLDPFEDIEETEDEGSPPDPEENESPLKRVFDSSQESPQPKIPKLATPSSIDTATLSKQPWKTEKDPDEAPDNLKFAPARQPGVQLDDLSSKSTPLDLFKLFFSENTVKTLCYHTNQQTDTDLEHEKQHKYNIKKKSINLIEFYNFIGMVLFVGQLKLRDMVDCWRQNHLFSMSYLTSCMDCKRYLYILRNLHISYPMDHLKNNQKKGTPEYDALFCLQPLMNDIRQACQTFYHPQRDLNIHEWTVPLAAGTKERVKLFALTDANNSYTVDFIVYKGKTTFPTGSGMSYDAVMSLVRPAFLGSGYHLYLDNFFSSPKLFQDLLVLKMGACGTMLEGRRGFPRSEENALTKKSPRGSLRWMRKGSLLFVKWKDTREVSTASTIHQAYGGDTVDRRVKNKDGSWTLKSIPVPAPVLAYDQHKKSVNSSDQMNQYFSDQPGIMGGYNFLFFHFLDMAVTNSYGIHVELCKKDTTAPMTRHAFIEELTTTLCGMTITLRKELKWRNTRLRRKTTHVPVLVEMPIPVRKQSYVKKVLKRCLQCKKNGVNIDSQWKCQECQVALCINPDRKCFHEWHQ